MINNIYNIFLHILYMLNINIQSIYIMQNKKYIFNYEKNISIQILLL